MKSKRFLGIILIVVGIAFCFGLLLYQYQHCVDIWSNSNKHNLYPTALDYFYEVSLGAIIISLFGGIVLVAEGIVLCAKT